MGMGNNEKSDNPYASKLDVLAAAASEAAGKPQTPATSAEVTASAPPVTEAATAAADAEDEPEHGKGAAGGGIAESKRTPSKRPRSAVAVAAVDGGDEADIAEDMDGNAAGSDARGAYPSPGLRSPGNFPFLSPGTAGKQLLSPGNRGFGLGAEDLLGHNLQLDLQALDHQQEGVLDLLREQGIATEDMQGNLSEFNSPFGTPNSLLQVRSACCCCHVPALSCGSGRVCSVIGLLHAVCMQMLEKFWLHCNVHACCAPLLIPWFFGAI